MCHPRRHGLLAALLLSSLGACALAQTDAPLLNQSYWVQLGAMASSSASVARVDHPATGQPGTDVDLERELGLPRHRTLGTLLVGARVGGAWRGEFEWLSLARQARQQVLTGTISWDDTVFPAAVSVDSEVDTKVARLGVGYSFHRTPGSEWGVVGGLHVTRFNLQLAGNGTLGNSGSIALRQVRREATVPLPTVGTYGTWALTPRWLVSGRADLLKLRLRGHDGRLLSLSASAVYRFTANAGVGLGYRWVDYQLDTQRSGDTGRYDYRYRGPQVFVDLGF